MPKTPLPGKWMAELPLGSGPSVDLGSAVALDLSGASPASITCWLKPHASSANLSILKRGTFTFTLAAGRLSSTIPGSQARVTSPTALEGGRWHHVGMTFDRFAAGGPVLTLYVNGEPVISQVSAAPSLNVSGPFTLGGGGRPWSLWRLGLFSVALAPEEVTQTMYHEPTAGMGGLVAAYKMGQVPPLDASGRGNPMTFVGSSQQILIPHVSFGGNGLVVPSHHDTANPGRDAYTLQAWVLPEAASSEVQTIVANGSVGEAETIELGLEASAGAYKVRAGHGSTVLTSTDPVVVPGIWSNVAVVYDPAGPGGKQLFLYWNGDQVASVAAPRIAGRHSPQITVGSIGGATMTRHLSGGLQNVSLWTRALSQQEVADHMYPVGYGATEGLAAYYDLAVVPSADSTLRNLVSSNPLGHHGSARPTVSTLRDSDVVPNAEAGPAQAAARRAAGRRDAELRRLAAITSPSGTGGFDLGRVHPDQFGEERLRRVVAEVESAIPANWSSERRAGFRRELEAGLAASFVRAREARGPLPGMVTHERIGDRLVFFFHAEHGPQAVAEVPVARVDECTAWKIDMAATALFGLLDVLEVPVTPAIVSQAIESLMRSSKVARAFAEAFAGEITTRTYIACVKALFDADYFDTFLEAVLDSLAWWDWLFFAVNLAITLLSFLIPGAAIAWLLAKLAVILSTLVYVASQRPAGC